MKPQLTYFSVTSEGAIPHRKYKSYRLCVKLDTDNRILTTNGYAYPPLRRDGKLVFALPGGGEYVE